MSLAIRQGKARGDPGLFGFLGKAIGTVAKVGTSLLPGPIGALARAGVSAVTKQPRAAALPVPTAMPTLPMPSYPGAPRSISVATMGPREPQPTQFMADVTPAIGCPKGYKPNKSAYYRRIVTPGNPEGILVHVAPGSRCVRIRKRNAANPRAADRAIGRIESAKRFARRMDRVTVKPKCPCPPRRRRK